MCIQKVMYVSLFWGANNCSECLEVWRGPGGGGNDFLTSINFQVLICSKD
jgi:hypothetical protein